MKKLEDMKKSELIEIIEQKTKEAGESEFQLNAAMSDLRSMAGERDKAHEAIEEMKQAEDLIIDTLAEAIDYADNVIHWSPDNDRSYERHVAKISMFNNRLEMTRRTQGVVSGTDNLTVEWIGRGRAV